MTNLTMTNLELCFETAKELNKNYVAVLIQMDGFPKDEIIINEYDNIDTKLAYYKKTYGEDLKHNFANGIEIIGCTFGNTFEEIESDLIK